jgi:hypothetical protein
MMMSSSRDDRKESWTALPSRAESAGAKVEFLESGRRCLPLPEADIQGIVAVILVPGRKIIHRGLVME